MDHITYHRLSKRTVIPRYPNEKLRMRIKKGLSALSAESMVQIRQTPREKFYCWLPHTSLPGTEIRSSSFDTASNSTRSVELLSAPRGELGRTELSEESPELEVFQYVKNIFI